MLIASIYRPEVELGRCIRTADSPQVVKHDKE